MSSERTDIFLMANLGSEVSRLLSARERGDTAEMEHSLERAETIFAALETSGISKGGHVEVKILKEVIKDVCSKEPSLSVNPQALRDYFHPFTKQMLKQA